MSDVAKTIEAVWKIEVRQIHEMPDFPEDVQKAAEGFEHRNVVA